MDADPVLVAHLLDLESDLLRPEIRRSRDRLEALLAPDFLELGASGRTYDRASLVAALADEASAAHAGEEPASVRVEAFAVRLLARDVALATYRSVRTGTDGEVATVSLRSSIWRRDAGAWRMVFHQGTRSA